ncbi:hypothetical protein Aperf_G00000030344 [Anoplocephala perfoliata]
MPNDESSNEKESSSLDNCQVTAESYGDHKGRMRFYMDFIYPTVEPDQQKAAIKPLPSGKHIIPFSMDLTDNFDNINLTQMLEGTTAESVTAEEIPQDGLQISSKGSEKSSSGTFRDLSHPVNIKTPTDANLESSSFEFLNQASGPLDESTVSLEDSLGINIFCKKTRDMSVINVGFEKASKDPLESSPIEGENHTNSLPEECQYYFTEPGSSSKLEAYSRQPLKKIPISNDQEGPSKPPLTPFDERSGFCMGFKTAAGGTLRTPSIESLKRAKRIFEEEKGFTNQESALTTALAGEETLEKPFCGFKTASGARLKTPSVESLTRAKRLIEECKDLIKDSDTTAAFKAADGSLKTPSSQAFNRINQVLEDSSDQSTICKETAFPLESIERSSYLYEDNADPTLSQGPIRLIDTATNLILGSTTDPVIASAPSGVPLTTGFTTGSGKAVTLASLASLESSKRFIEECLKKSNAAILNQRVEGSVKSSTSDEYAPLVDGNKVCDFVSASGKHIKPISVESVERAAALVNEHDDELESMEEKPTIKSPSLDVSASPTAKGVNCAMSPVLDFDGSFEISSQIMNVLEGKTSQLQPNEESLLIEEQRDVLRAQQGNEAESRFKPLDTAILTFSRNGSVSSRTSCSETHKVIQKPVTPGLLWQSRRGCVRPVTQNSRIYSTPANKDLFFVNDFLRLDNASSLSLTTVSELKFKMDSDGMSTSYLLGDHVEIIPDCFGYAGCLEVVRGFVCSPGVTSGLASHQWITHHFRQLAWRFGSIALLHYGTLVQHVFPNLSLPDSSVGRTDGRLFLHVLLLELRYRYDRELEAVQRPAIRKILERDDTPAKRIVLCVSHLERLSDHQYRGRLTDGWYHIDWVPDPMLTRLIELGRIRVGTKMVTAGAELIQAPSGFGGGVESAKGENAHLFGDSSIGLALRLSGNSTVPAPPNARLGFANRQPMAHLPPTPLFSISPDGGTVSSICVLIQRRFQLQYMETCPPDNGAANETEGRQHVFRDPRSERAAERLHTEKCQRAFDKAVTEFASSHSESGERLGSRTQPKASYLDSLGLDGEALWNAVNNALDPGLAESDLSPAQRDAMLRYKETVTQLLRLQVAGIHPQDVKRRLELPLTLWNPTEETLEVLQEGSIVQLNRLHVSTTRPTDPFAPPISSTIDSGQLVSLSGGRGTTVRPLKVTELVKFSKNGQPTDSMSVLDLIETVYRPRTFLSVGDLQSIAGSSCDRPKVVDFKALVIGSKMTSATNTGKSDFVVVYLASLRNEGGEEDFSTLAVLRIWGGLERYCLKSVLSAGNRVRFTDIQLRSINKLQIESDFPPDGSPEVNCVMLNYTTASYVTTETVPRDGSGNKRFQTPWKETPQFYSYMQACMESHFEKFFSKKSFTCISTSSSSHSSSRLTSFLTLTSKADSKSKSALVGNMKEQNSVKLEASVKSIEPLAIHSPIPKTRTRTGLCRPRRSISAALSVSTSNTSTVLNELLIPVGEPLQNTRRHREAKQSHPTPSAFSTPLPAKRPFPTISENLDDPEALVAPSSINASPVAKRHCSTLFASSSPKQEVRMSPRLETSGSAQFDFPPVSPALSSNTESTEPQTDMDSSLTFPAEIKASDSPPELNSSMALEDASVLDVSIADLVKTRKRKCSSQKSLPASRKRPLRLKNTQ